MTFKKDLLNKNLFEHQQTQNDFEIVKQIAKKLRTKR
jgi:hypothetical protein